MPIEPMNIHYFSLCIHRFVEIFWSVLVNVFDNRRSRNEYLLYLSNRKRFPSLHSLI